MTNTLIGLIQAALLAVYGVLNTFGVWTMTENQRGAVLALYAALAAIVLALNAAYGKAAEIRAAARSAGVTVPKV